MTDEEMASNYADTVKCEWENETYLVDCRDKVEDAFIAGLKAGRQEHLDTDSAYIKLRLHDAERLIANLSNRLSSHFNNASENKLIIEALWFLKGVNHV